MTKEEKFLQLLYRTDEITSYPKSKLNFSLSLNKL